MLEETGLEVEVRSGDRSVRPHHARRPAARALSLRVDRLFVLAGQEERCRRDPTSPKRCWSDPSELAEYELTEKAMSVIERATEDGARSRRRPGSRSHRRMIAVSRRRLDAADRMDQEREPAQTRARRRGGRPRLRARVRRRRRGLGHRRACCTISTTSAIRRRPTIPFAGATSFSGAAIPSG